MLACSGIGQQLAHAVKRIERAAAPGPRRCRRYRCRGRFSCRAKQLLHRADDAVQAAGDAHQPLDPPARHIGQAEQADGFGRGRGVNDQHIVFAGLEVLADPEQLRALFQAGDDGHFGGVDLGDALAIEEGAQVFLDFAPVLLHGIARIDFLRPEVSAIFVARARLRHQARRPGYAPCRC